MSIVEKFDQYLNEKYDNTEYYIEYLNELLTDMNIDESTYEDLDADTIINIQEELNDYQKFFKDKLKKYGVKSPSELSDSEKTKFFKEVKDEWK